MKSKLPKELDLSLLSFLEYGDLTLIAREERESGRKTSSSYVSRVCSGKHRNDRILKRAFEIALRKREQFPTQAIIQKVFYGQEKPQNS